MTHTKLLFGLRTLRGRSKLITTKSYLSTVAAPNATQTNSTAATPEFEEAWRNARPYSEVPGPSMWELVKMFRPGGTLDGVEFFGIVDEFQRRYGNICKLPGSLGRSDMVFVYDPADFETIYRTEGQYPERWAPDSLGYYRKVLRKDVYAKTRGISVDQGKEWWDFRHKVNPVMMQPRVTKQYVPKMDEISKDLVDKIRTMKDSENKLSDDFLPMLSRWALESVCYVSMDIRIGLLGDKKNPRAEKFIQTLKLFFDYAYQLDILPSTWKFIKTSTFHKSMRNNDEMMEGALYFLEKGKKALAEKKKLNLDPNGEKGVFEKLLEIDEDVALVMTLDSIIAGVDTTGTSFFNLLQNLAHNPEKQEILRKEIMKVLPTSDSVLTAESMKDMPYLRATIKESYRFTPFFDNIRSAGKDLVLQGYQIPKSTRISMAQHSLLKSDQHYERSNEFLPERFLRTAKGSEPDSSGCPHKVSAHPFIYLPFGFGPRMCIGRRFAELEIETLIVRMLREFRVEWNGPPPTYINSLGQLPVGKTSFVFNEIKN